MKLQDVQFKSTNIKGKEYIEVNERLKAFRTCEEFKGYSLESEIIKFDGTSILIKAVIKDENGRILATGLGFENQSDSMINQTSFVENCETSAWGRALANLGIGIDSSVASSNEVNNAIANQKQYENKQYNQQKKLVKDLQYGHELAIGDEVPFQFEDSQVFYKLCFNKTKNSYFYAIVNEDNIHPKFLSSQFE